jgi:hypothetical protein
LKGGMFTVGATVLSAGLAPCRLRATQDDDRAPITKGDIAILRFLQALETIEADLWQQYSELGGTQDNEGFAVKYGATVLAAPIRGGFDNVAWAASVSTALAGRCCQDRSMSVSIPSPGEFVPATHPR